MTPHEALKLYWGYENFRPKQLEIIESVLGGHDTLGLMPTGGGKSVTFQVPALIQPGITIVVTPLISLMKDQVDNLKSRNISAAALYSGMPRRERNLVLDKARLDKIKLIYISPERLGSESFRAEMRDWDVSLIVVDEAHCISQWGYDFRPSYLKIALLRDIFPDIPVLALTASATPRVQADIKENLHFHKDSKTFALSFHRHNLSYVVRYESDKEGKLIDALSAVKGCAIVYVRSRRATAQYAAALNNAGITATFYHAGLDPLVKEKRQQEWKDGKVRVMVATNAFGMGIDKADVRVVVHLDIPPSLEEYYQEAGRAGRDGKHSYALMIVSPYDKATLTRRLNNSFPPKEYVREIYEKACVFMQIAVGEGYGHVYEFNLDKFCKTFGYYPETVQSALTILTNAGYFDYNEDPTTRARVTVLIRREEFYGLQVTPSEADVINSLLRLYPGLFADYVNIDEITLAVSSGLQEGELYEALLSLSRKKIIDYIPKRILPYIYIPTSRELTKHIEIPPSVYEERRALMEQRLEAMRRFAFSSEQCRDRVLLEYFGENDTTDCEFCDVCKERKKIDNSPLDKIEAKLFNEIQENSGLEFNSLIRKSAPSAEKRIEALKSLMAQKRIERIGNKLFIKKND